jgi:hypothetical protein
VILRRPPERRRRSVTLAAHGCCCCCCLHALGSLSGAAVASSRAKEPAARRTVLVYWLLVLASTLLGTAGMLMTQSLDFTIIVGLLYFPLAQFNASFLTLCAKIFVEIDLRTLGRITWHSFLWGLVGFIVMAVPLFLMARFG